MIESEQAFPHTLFLKRVRDKKRSSTREGKLAENLRKKDIYMVNMRGGILAWLHAGGKVYREGKPVNQVHVYGKKWDLAPPGIESVV